MGAAKRSLRHGCRYDILISVPMLVVWRVWRVDDVCIRMLSQFLNNVLEGLS